PSGPPPQDPGVPPPPLFSKPLFFCPRCPPRRPGHFRRHILAPCNNLHSKCAADPRDLSANIAEPEDSEGFAVKIFADRALPAAVADGRIFLNNVAHTRENKSPGHLNRWR